MLRTRELLNEAKGLPTDEHSITCGEKHLPDNDSARRYLAGLKTRLRDLSQWNDNSGLSTYELFDKDGRPATEPTIKPGLFIKITLHGSGKSDWVLVEDVFDSPDEIVITVRPTFDPTDDPQKTGKTSHFFGADATNNFCAFAEGDRVSVYVIGLNERLNSGHTSNVVETLRNTAVANLGYYLGIQKAEWTKFCESFLSGDLEHAAK